MAIILFDNNKRNNLQPFTATKAIAALRFGIVTIAERWALKTKQEVFVHTEKYLQGLYPTIENDDNIWVDASIMLTDNLLDRILSLQADEALANDCGLIAGRSTNAWHTFNVNESLQWFKNIYDVTDVACINYPAQLFHWNDRMIREDFELLTAGKTSEPISHSNQVINAQAIFLENNVTLEFCTLNASTGPIYIAKDAVIMEGSILRGPLVIGQNNLVKMGSKFYGATTFGPNCVVGGEIKNVVFQGCSNKAHDGYLGDSVIGEWCNLGAGTSNSNVKNTGGDVHMWNEGEQAFISGGQKCGVVMGDYSRTAINSSINTGTFIGVCCNVFGNGLLPKKIPNYTWGTLAEYNLEKAFTDINNWKQMKQQSLTDAEVAILKHIFDHTKH